MGAICYYLSNLRYEEFIVKKMTLLATLLGSFIASSALAEDIKIGMFTNLTGDYSALGQDARRVAELFVEKLNEKGGINGDKVELIIEDSGSLPRMGATAATRLVSSGVKTVVGTFGSAVTEATQDIFDEANMVQVADGSTAVRLTEKGLEKFFRVSPRDDEQGRVGAATLTKLGFNKIAILHDNTSYAKGLADEIDALVKANADQEVVFFDALVPGESDYSVVLTRIKSANPQVIFFTGYYPEAGLLLRQRREMGWDIPVVGGDASTHLDLIEIAGKQAAEGFRFISPPLPTDIDNEATKAFLASYYERHNTYPSTIWAFNAADALGVLVAAMEVKGNDADAIADYLHNEMKDFDGFAGKISFDQKGDRVGDFYRLYEYNADGQPVLQPQE